MAVHAAWPPLAILAMFVMIVAFLIVKYGDQRCGIRSIPWVRSNELEGDETSVNTMSCMYDEKDSVRELVEIDMPEMEPVQEKREKYEYAV